MHETNLHPPRHLMASVVPDIPQLTASDDVAAILIPRLAEVQWPTGEEGVQLGDIIVVAEKMVARAEGLLADGRSEDLVKAEIARQAGIGITAGVPDAEITLGASYRHCLRRQILPNAGVWRGGDLPYGLILKPLPNPDQSARRIRLGVAARSGVRLGIVIARLVHRTARMGASAIAVGAAGVDLTPRDDSGPVNALDAIAHLADLLFGYGRRTPAVAIRGLEYLSTYDDGPGAAIAGF